MSLTAQLLENYIHGTLLCWLDPFAYKSLILTPTRYLCRQHPYGTFIMGYRGTGGIRPLTRTLIR